MVSSDKRMISVKLVYFMLVEHMFVNSINYDFLHVYSFHRTTVIIVSTNIGTWVVLSWFDFLLNQIFLKFLPSKT